MCNYAHWSLWTWDYSENSLISVIRETERDCLMIFPYPKTKVPKTVNNTLTPDGTETLETANFWNFIYSLTSGTPLDVTRHRGRQQWRHQRFMTSSKQFRRVCFLCVLPDTIVRVFTVSVTVTKICGKSSFSWFRHLALVQMLFDLM